MSIVQQKDTKRRLETATAGLTRWRTGHMHSGLECSLPLSLLCTLPPHSATFEHGTRSLAPTSERGHTPGLYGVMTNRNAFNSNVVLHPASSQVNLVYP